MKETREQLIAELAKIRNSHADWVSNDERRRKEFAKAFNWYKRVTTYDYGDRDPLLPSWEQIFVELGKLLSAQNFTDFEGNISELECKLEDLEKKLKMENKPNS